MSVSFGIPNVKMIYPCASAVFTLMRSLLPVMFKANPYKCSISFKSGLMGEGMFICIIFELIRIKQTETHFIQPIKKYKEKPHLIPLIILSGIMDYCGFFFGAIPNVGKDSEVIIYYTASCMLIFQFLFVYFIFYYFYKTRTFYRHHLVSIALIIIGTLFGVGEYITNLSLIDLFSIISGINVGLLEILMYKLMNENGDYLSPYEIVWIQGFINFCIGVALSLVFSLIPCSNTQFCADNGKVANVVKDFGSLFSNWQHLLQGILFILASTGHNLFRILTTKYLGPTYRIISDGIISIITMTIALDQLEKTFKLTIHIIGHIIFFVGLLMYNEIMIVHMCKLDVDTLKSIHERLTIDSKADQGDDDDKTKELVDDVPIPTPVPTPPSGNPNSGYDFDVDKSKTEF